MATIEIYSKLGELQESHEYSGSLMGFLRSIDGIDLRLPFPFSASITDYNRILGSDETVRLTIEPRDPVTTTLIIIAAISAGYAYYVTSNLPDGYESSISQGRSIYAPATRVNSAIPSGVIREAAGKITIYPDLIVPARKRFESNDEYLYLGLSVSRGHMDISQSNVYIDQTPSISYQSDITVNIVEPGGSVASVPAFENWYTSKEVSDLELTTVSDALYGNWTVDYSGATITSTLDGAATAFPFSVGEDFQIIGGTNPGYYRVVSISGASNEIATVDDLSKNKGNSPAIRAQGRYIDVNRASAVGRNIVINSFTNNGAASFTLATGEAVAWVSQGGGVDWNGPYRAAPQGETSRYSEFDVFFPRGLTNLNDDGENTSYTVDIEVQWRPVGGTTWATVSGTSYTDATYDQLGFTVSVDFGAEIEPEFRFRRVTKESDDNSVVETVQIKRLKTKLETPSSYPDITCLGVKLRGTNTLARTAENKINVRGATRKLPTIAELQSGSWDLSDAATKIDGTYLISGAEFVNTTQMSNIGEFPTSYVSGITSDIGASGNKIVVYSNNIARFWHSYSPYEPAAGTAYNGYLLIGNSDKSTPRVVRLAGNDTYLVTMYERKSPASDYLISSQPISLPANIGEVALNGSPTGYILPSAKITAAVSFYIYPNGSRYYVANNDSVIHQFNVGTAHDLSTTTDPAISFDASTQLGGNTIKSVWLTDYSGGSDPSKLYVADSSGVIYQYTLSTPGDISTASYGSTMFLPNDVPNGGIHVTSNKLITASAISSDIFVSIYNLQETLDSRKTRSAMRFAASALYDALGDDAAEMIDWTEMQSLDTLLESRGDYLDADFVDETTLWEAEKIMLSPGYCEATLKDGKFTPIRISSGSDYTQIYTPDVMIGQGLQVQYQHHDTQEPDGVDVEYFSLITNSNEVVECRSPGDLGLRPKRIQAIGITDETKAWRLGMRERNRIRYKPANYTFTTEMDALNSNYGDPVGVCSDLFTSQYGEVVSYSAPDVELDFTPSFGSGTHYAAFKNRQGELSGLYTVIAGAGNEIELTSPTSLDFVPVTDGSMDATLVSFGNSSEWGRRAIVRRIEPSGDNVEVTCEEYVAAVFQDDDNAPS